MGNSVRLATTFIPSKLAPKERKAIGLLRLNTRAGLLIAPKTAIYELDISYKNSLHIHAARLIIFDPAISELLRLPWRTVVVDTSGTVVQGSDTTNCVDVLLVTGRLNSARSRNQHDAIGDADAIKRIVAEDCKWWVMGFPRDRALTVIKGCGPAH